ncbi:hypothetical protein [Streptomyces sp. NPDC001404]|uniref:hypothetical protein n=1 Tax=Streptomyces sp. NPDC001404 TaxID=3364571 RepID=UPI0036C62D52
MITRNLTQPGRLGRAAIVATLAGITMSGFSGLSPAHAADGITDGKSYKIATGGKNLEFKSIGSEGGNSLVAEGGDGETFIAHKVGNSWTFESAANKGKCITYGRESSGRLVLGSGECLLSVIKWDVRKNEDGSYGIDSSSGEGAWDTNSGDRHIKLNTAKGGESQKFSFSSLDQVVFGAPHIKGADCSVGEYGKHSTTWWKHLTVQLPTNGRLPEGAKLYMTAKEGTYYYLPLPPSNGSPGHTPMTYPILPESSVLNLDGKGVGEEIFMENGGRDLKLHGVHLPANEDSRNMEFVYVLPGGYRSEVSKVSFNDNAGLGCSASIGSNGPAAGKPVS